jgi:Ala-tRNA(Pro) deacylase
MPASRDELFERLKSLGIETITKSHAPVFTVEEAQKIHHDIPGGHCKNLFCKDEKGAIWLIVCLESARVDLKLAPSKIGSKRLTFGKPDLLMDILGVEPGSVTPFGLINDLGRRTNVILDADMMKREILNYHPLKNTETTSISSADLLNFISSCGHAPKVVALAEPIL